MARLSYAVLFSLASLALVACGSKSSGNPDALVNVTDAKPPDAVPPDAFSCTAPLMECTTGACTNTDTDEANCGSCGMACQGGASCLVHACTCPASFIPATVTSVGIVPDQFFAIGATTTAGLQLFSGGASLDAFVSVIDPATIKTGQEYDLSKTTFGASPSIAAGYNIDVSSKTVDAYYVATSGKLTFTKACATEMQGTITGATFQGATGDLASGTIAVDPNGCTFDVATTSFHLLKAGMPCP